MPADLRFYPETDNIVINIAWSMGPSQIVGGARILYHSISILANKVQLYRCSRQLLNPNLQVNPNLQAREKKKLKKIIKQFNADNTKHVDTIVSSIFFEMIPIFGGILNSISYAPPSRLSS